MSRAEAPRVDSGAEKRRAPVNPESESGAASREIRATSEVAWWAESWTPLQPSPAPDPLPWLSADQSLSISIDDPRDGEMAPLVRSDARQAMPDAAEPTSNLPALTIEERRARAAALRALLLARQRRFESAEQAFREAAELDPALDLSHVTTFWDLERGGHEAAIRAYESLGRLQDAKWLRARVDTRYRPRLVRSA